MVSRIARLEDHRPRRIQHERATAATLLFLRCCVRATAILVMWTNFGVLLARPASEISASVKPARRPGCVAALIRVMSQVT